MSASIGAIKEMGKLLFYLFIAGLVYWMFSNRHSKQAKDDVLPETSEAMVCCTHCGIYLPKSEAVRQQDTFFCCREHCRLHEKSSL